MVATISDIGTEISLIISKTSSIATISEQEKINNFLDSINRIKKSLEGRVEKLKQIEKLFTQLTWVDIKNKQDEELINIIIIKSKKFHSKLLRNYVNLKTSLWQSNICRKEITDYKNILDDIEDSIFEIEQIFFSLRNDDEFNELLKSL
jgi:DNA mismatch repair ATPase MutS